MKLSSLEVIWWSTCLRVSIHSAPIQALYMFEWIVIQGYNVVLRTRVRLPLPRGIIRFYGYLTSSCISLSMAVRTVTQSPRGGPFGVRLVLVYSVIFLWAHLTTFFPSFSNGPRSSSIVKWASSCEAILGLAELPFHAEEPTVCRNLSLVVVQSVVGRSNQTPNSRTLKPFYGFLFYLK